jgi:hypothetical protein
MNMTAKELFGVGVRLVGLVAAFNYLPALVQLNYVAAAPGIVGLIMLTRADFIARLCYPEDSREQADRDLRDFR